DPGEIFAQEPAEGTKVSVGTPVYLSVATAVGLMEVSNLVGRPLEEASGVLHDLRLQMVATPAKTDEHQPGIVVDQRPAAGAKVPLGTPVYLTVSTTADLVQLTNLVGRTLETASTILHDAGLQVVVTEEDAPKSAPGVVLRQHPAAATQIGSGNPVYLVVAVGAEAAAPAETEVTPETSGPIAEATAAVTVPNLAGRTLKEAQGVLAEAGLLTAVRVEEEISEQTPGTVLRQSPAAGTPVTAGSSVRLVVAARQAFSFNLIFVLLSAALVLAVAFAVLRAKKIAFLPKPAVLFEPQVKIGSQDIRTSKRLKSEMEVRLKPVLDFGQQAIQLEGRAPKPAALDHSPTTSEGDSPQNAVPGSRIRRGPKATNEMTSPQLDPGKPIKFAWQLRLKPVLDDGKQELRVDGALILREKDRTKLRAGTIAAVEDAATSVHDDLTQIEGIGPRISHLFQTAGITTFAGLAAADTAYLRKILQNAGIWIADPTTWPEQAELAASGNWDALNTLQQELKGGRRVSAHN
ncbi:MAG: PASTA domain-containing protein, partial [bacterium]